MKIHLISIGGAVMHNIALALQKNGHTVTGSDDEVFEPSRSRLAQAGLLPGKMGWDQAHITPNIEMVILGMHARADNPELEKALQMNIPVLSFPEFVYEKSKDKKRIVIGGSHGKTTTTAMIMHALKVLDIDFDYLVGSQLEGFETMVRFSDASLMVIEGDEYLTSTLDPKPKFHWYKPHIAVLTGIAWDHINVFPTFENYVDQFRIFCETMQPGSKLYYFGQDDELKEVVRRSPAECIPYGSMDHYVDGNSIRVRFNGKEYPFSVFGEHNYQNLEAAFLVCCELGVDPEQVIRALSTFKGTARRLETVYEDNELVVIRDFAHSPSKARASVSAVRSRFPDSNLIAVYELHTFSSLNREFIPHYDGTLSMASHALVYYNPEVVEHKRLPAIDPDFVKGSFGAVEVFTDAAHLAVRIAELKKKDTVLLLMSSGNFSGLDFSALR